MVSTVAACAQRVGPHLLGVPWVVPPVQPIELFFFHRVFQELCERRTQRVSHNGAILSARLPGSPEVPEEQEVTLAEFQRAMLRLFRVIKDDRKFNIAEYDVNGNGRVGWYEFCSLWKERGVSVRLSLAERLFLTFEDAERSLLGKIWSILIFAAIVVSTSSFIISTMPEMQTPCAALGSLGYDEKCKPTPKDVFKTIDLFCVVLFTVEYAARLLLSAQMRSELLDSDKRLLVAWMVTDEVPQVPSTASRVLSWVLHWSNLIDLAAIMPWYLSEAFKSSGGDESIFLKIIRLTRVIRAFRLGRRFEAVIIIMRSVRRSVRALYVLILNVLLGITIFGALMYFAEQGTWDPETQAYLRWEDATTQSKSPFDSIPACFWWAIVTATTVGYGDDHTPSTLSGKLVAVLTMVWSLCVLALPIGVIGGNFSQVWEEYDAMKHQEEQNRLREDAMLKRSIAWGDPLHHSRKVLLELWHNSGLPAGQNDPLLQSEFMGEVDCSLDLGPNEAVTKCLRLPVSANVHKARRKVRGSLTFEYSWRPLTKKDPGTLLQGQLDITVMGAENLISIDWKGSHLPDTYCIVIAHPVSPGTDGSIPEVAQRTSTVRGASSPRWGETLSFDVCWAQAASQHGLMADMRQAMPEVRARGSRRPVPRALSCRKAAAEDPAPPEAGASTLSSPTPASTSHAGKAEGPSTLRALPEAEVLHQVLPGLQSEVEELKCTLPQLRLEIGGVRRDMQLILAALERQDQQCKCSAADPAEALSLVRHPS